jgi:hypothetical protein
MLIVAALPPVTEAEPLRWHSQSETGNETMCKSLLGSGFHVKLTPMSDALPLRRGHIYLKIAVSIVFTFKKLLTR